MTARDARDVLVSYFSALAKNDVETALKLSSSSFRQRLIAGHHEGTGVTVSARDVLAGSVRLRAQRLRFEQLADGARVAEPVAVEGGFLLSVAVAGEPEMPYRLRYEPNGRLVVDLPVVTVRPS